MPPARALRESGGALFPDGPLMGFFPTFRGSIVRRAAAYGSCT